MDRLTGHILKNEQGFALVFAILLLLVLVIVGISATTTTTVEVQIAASDKFHKMAFYNADAGIGATPKVISQVIEEGDTVDVLAAHPFAYAQPGKCDDPLDTGVCDTVVPAEITAELQARLYDEVNGFENDDTSVVFSTDLTFPLEGETVQIDFRKDRTESLVGAPGEEFGSGASGAGGGTTAGVAIFYPIDSKGGGPKGSVSSLSAEYRKVPGAAGGL